MADTRLHLTQVVTAQNFSGGLCLRREGKLMSQGSSPASPDLPTILA